MDQRKIATFEDGEWRPLSWEDQVWAVGAGLTLAPRDPWGCFLELSSRLDPGYVLEWQFSHPEGEVADGLYLSPMASREELDEFLHLYRDFFAQDGRGVLAISAGESRLTLDEHNWVQWEGETSPILEWASARGFVAGECDLPFPHQHIFHEHLTSRIFEIYGARPWRRFELTPS